jgi:hypothetical protein
MGCRINALHQFFSGPKRFKLNRFWTPFLSVAAPIRRSTGNEIMARSGMRAHAASGMALGAFSGEDRQWRVNFKLSFSICFDILRQLI